MFRLVGGDASPPKSATGSIGNEQRRMNDLVEIVVGEVAVLQLHRMKIRISCLMRILCCVLLTREF